MADFRYPKNWRPNWVKTREKGNREDVYFGQKGADKHGHTVKKGKDVKYARTPEGRVLEDKKENKRDKYRKILNRNKNKDKDISGR